MEQYLLDKNWEYAESGLLNPLMVHMLNNWKKTDLPHDYGMEKERSKEAPGGLDEGFTQGAGLYYKKTFLLEKEAMDQRIWLEFEGVSGYTEVWVNQKFVSKHVNPYTGFWVEITDLVKEGENTVMLHTDSRMKPCSRWYIGAGLYRPVRLLLGEKNTVEPHGIRAITKRLEKKSADVAFEVQITGEDGSHEVRVKVEDEKGTLLEETAAEAVISNGKGTVCLEMSLTSITPWSPETPQLYEVKVSVDGGEAYEERFGIRTIQTDPVNGFRLNGKPMKLKGGCIHHDLGILGVADYEAAEYRRIRILKDNGYNAVRLAHNPFGPAIFKVCDELGMLAVEEAFDEWVLGRTSFGSHLFFEDSWERDLEAMIRRDYNHPSIIMWSTGNEVEERDGSADGFTWSKKLAEKVRSLDQTRPVSATACSLFVEYTNQRPKEEEGTTGNQALNMAYDNFASGVDLWGDATAAYFEPLDVAGYNYKTMRYEHDGKKFPDRVIYGSESYPRAAFDSWEAAVKNPNVIGDFVWTAWDYIGEVGVGRWEVSDQERPDNPKWPWMLANCSDLDLIGEKRPQSYYRDAVWENDHAPHLFTLSPELTGKHLARLSWAWLPVAANYTFPGKEGSAMEAHIYANADEVELFLNGESLGRHACGYEQQYQTVFSFAYVPGTLEAVAYREGQECGRDRIRTAKETSTLRLLKDRETIAGDGRDLCFVTICAEDQQQIPVYNETGILTVTVEGGELAALGTADPKPDRLIPYQGETVPMFEGKALAVIKARPGSTRCTVRAVLENGAENSIEISFTQKPDKEVRGIREPKDGALNLPLGELLKQDAAREILNQMIPGILENPMLEHMKSMTLGKMAAMGGMQFDPKWEKELDRAMGL